MFNRDTKQARIDTLIGKASRVHGDLEFAGGLHLEGNVEADNVMLNGAVRGDIVARERIVLGATATVQGNVYYGVIEMTLGAQIMGKLTRVPDKSVETPPDGTAGST